jgi:hypothetical protein
MSYEQICALVVGLIGFPFIYWLGFDISFKAGRERELYEMARMEMDQDPKFRQRLLSAQLDIINRERAKHLFENE